MKEKERERETKDCVPDERGACSSNELFTRRTERSPEITSAIVSVPETFFLRGYAR